MVINVGALRSGDHDAVRQDIGRVVEDRARAAARSSR
jgi:deoxyribose-phosphate aldolase